MTGAGRREEIRQGLHAQAFRTIGPGESRADRHACRFVATLAARPSRRRLAIGRAADGEPILAPREAVSTTRCATDPTARLTRIRTGAAGSRRRAVLAIHAFLARR